MTFKFLCYIRAHHRNRTNSVCVCTDTERERGERDYEELAHVMMGVANSKSAGWASRLKTQGRASVAEFPIAQVRSDI